MGWIFLIALVLFFSFSFLLEYLFYSTSKKEQQEDRYITRTHAPKRRMVVSFVIMASLFLTSIIIALFFIFSESELDLAGWIAYAISCLFAVGLPALIFLICIADYEVITRNSIIVHRLNKTTEILYDEIDSYKYSFNQLTVYGANDKVLFFVADTRVGLASLIKEFEARRIKKR
jgi:hypothetical protein